MTKFSVRILAVASLAILGACNSPSYKKTPSGLMYKIFPGSDAPQVKIGDIIKVHYVQKINDSVLMSSYGKMPAYAKVDSVSQPYNPGEIFKYLHKGDSGMVVTLVDSLIKQNPGGQIPPFMKKGDKMVLTFKVVDVFGSEEAARADTEKENAKEMARMEKENATKQIESPKEVADFLAKKKITAQKTTKGTYVEIKSQGTGMQADSGKYVSVRYTGKSLLTEKEFENNLGADKPPFSFVLGQGQVIPGWDDGLKLLKKGAKATLYIPGTLAYGPRPGPGGQTFESLIFDVELVDVADKAPEQPQQMPMPPQGGQDGHGH